MTQKSTNFVYGLLGITIGILGYVYFPQAFAEPVSEYSDTADAAFIEHMIPHHEDALIMADLALLKATQPELVALSHEIKASQSAEIEEMRAWYTEWYGIDVPAQIVDHNMHGATMSQAEIEALSSAANFDLAFVQHMIPHHEDAVVAATDLLKTTERPRMRKLAKAIITAQQTEIELMQGWLQAWGGAETSLESDHNLH